MVFSKTTADKEDRIPVIIHSRRDIDASQSEHGDSQSELRHASESRPIGTQGRLQALQ